MQVLDSRLTIAMTYCMVKIKENVICYESDNLHYHENCTGCKQLINHI